MRKPILPRALACIVVVSLLVAVSPLHAFAAIGGADPPDKATVAPASSILPDAYENDDTSRTAKPIRTYSRHTWHEEPDGYNDNDWMYFTVAATGTPYLFEVVTPARAGSCSDPVIKIYDEATVGSASEHDVMAFGDHALSGNDYKLFEGSDAAVVFSPPHPGKYYVRVTSCGRLFLGSDTEAWGEYSFYAYPGFGRRLWGADRYQTALAVSRLWWTSLFNPGQLMGPALAMPERMDGIVVCNGTNMADAQVAGMLAAVTGSPLLLTNGAYTMPPGMMAELERLAERAYYGNGVIATGEAGAGQKTNVVRPDGPSKVPLYVVGGTSSISDWLARYMDRSPYMGAIVRVGGPNRYATAVAVMDRIMAWHMTRSTGTTPAFAVMGGRPTTAYIANGSVPHEVLMMAPVASGDCSPMFLTRRDVLPYETAAALRRYSCANAVVVGGTGSVSDAVVARIRSIVTSGTVTRIAGSDRYTTSKRLVDWQIANSRHFVNTKRMILASGTSPADAFCAVPLSYNMGNAPLLLTRPDRLSYGVRLHIQRYRPLTEVSYALGGPVSLWPSTYDTWNRSGRPFAYTPGMVGGFD